MSDEAREAICRRVREAFKERDAEGVSAREIAEISGLPYTAVRKYAGKKNQTLPKPQNLEALAKALGKSEKWLLHGTAPEWLDGDAVAASAADLQAVLIPLHAAVSVLGDAVLALVNGDPVTPSAARKLAQALGRLGEADPAAEARS